MGRTCAWVATLAVVVAAAFAVAASGSTWWRLGGRQLQEYVEKDTDYDREKGNLVVVMGQLLKGEGVGHGGQCRGNVAERR